MRFYSAVWLLLGGAVLIATTVFSGSKLGSVASRSSTNLSVEFQPVAELVAYRKVSSSRPHTRTATISVEGEDTQVELQLFDESAMPFTTYIPAGDFVAESDASGEGTGAKFYFATEDDQGNSYNEEAYVHVFFPSSAPDLAAMRQSVLGHQGILEENGWTVLERTQAQGYSWMRDRILYEQTTDAGDYMGAIYIGEHKGKVFLALTHYPLEYGEGFEPEAELILENLEFRN